LPDIELSRYGYSHSKGRRHLPLLPVWVEGWMVLRADLDTVTSSEIMSRTLDYNALVKIFGVSQFDVKERN
jgi:hypothetical protein